MSHSLRICFVSFTGYPDQGATYFYEMARSIAALGHHVTAVGVQRPGEPADVSEDGVRVVRLPVHLTVRWGSPRRWLAKASFFKATAAMIRRERFEVVHVYCTIGAGLLPVLARGHARWVLEHQTGAVSSRARAARWLEDRLRAAQGLTYDTNFANTAYLGHRLFGRDGSFEVVPAGVNPALFRPGGRRSLRDELAIPASATVFAHVGVLEQERGTDVPLRAFAAAFPTSRDAWLLMPGKGRQLGFLRRLAADLGVADRVWLPGYVSYREEVPRVLAAADAGISYLPPVVYYEGNPPMKVMEYLAAGLPVIASNVSSHHVLLRDRVNGLLAPPDYAGFARTLSAFAEDRQFQRALARGTVGSIAHLTYDRIAQERVLPAYRRLLPPA